MSKRLFIAIAVLGSLCWALSSTPRALSPADPTSAHYRQVLDTYCVTCHNQRLETGGVSLESADLSRVAEDRELWEKVVRKLDAGTMPPQGARRPERPPMH